MTPVLKDLGVTKSQSSRWQQLAALSPQEQEERIASAKQQVLAVFNRFRERAEKDPQYKAAIDGGCTVEDLDLLVAPAAEIEEYADV
jgi:hypothetical protein